MGSRFSNKILSVVSKSGLGYVGKLHAIDTKHYTVTLSKGSVLNSFIVVRVVNSANGDQIYPQVYDFVIFRGSDLQEVSVRELTPQDILVENDSAVNFVRFDISF